MSVLQGKKIVLIVTAGIAAYKSATLVRCLKKKGVNVQVLMTPSSHQFITPLTLSTLSKNPVYTDFFSTTDGLWNNHVDISQWADYIIVAPATSNSISKMASAQSDNLAIATYLSANINNTKTFVAPAMDLDMYKDKGFRDNLKKLEDKGDIIIYPNSGELASGMVGEGRMAEPEEISQFIENYIRKGLIFSGKKVLITAGPTYEYIDPVRYIGNFSSGKMGYSLAIKSEDLGAEVILISGPTNQKIPSCSSIKKIDVLSADQMFNEVFNYYNEVDVVIMAAAVSDYRPENISDKKIKKIEQNLVINLIKNKDILMEMGKQKKSQFLVGFALETDNEEENAKMKLKNKNLDAIVLNSLKDEGAGFGLLTNKINIFDKDNNKYSFPLKDKEEVAVDILSYISSKI